MISKRSKRFWVGACLAPVSLVVGLITIWLNEKQVHADANGFIDRSTPGYFVAFGGLFYLGVALTFCALVSTAIDYAKSKRGKIVGTSKNN
jgi:hypothetical protein